MADYQTTALQLAQAQGAVAALQGATQPVADALKAIIALQTTAFQSLQSAQTSMGSANSLTVGILSIIDTRSQTERAAGKAAAINFVKANPTCTEAQAIAAWTTGATSTFPPGCTMPVNNPAGLLEAYMNNAHAIGATPDTTWASFVTLLINTPLATLLAM